MLKIIKFGGTIINHSQYQDKILELIKNELKQNNKLLIVVSAIGREGEPYSTPSLDLLGKNLASKEKAELLSYGERISSLVFLNYLLTNNINASVINFFEIGINVRGDYLNANCNDLDNKYLCAKLKKYDVVIIPGFIATNEKNEICLLGKGGSDLTAIYLAKMFNLNSIDLYKDVNGVMSGDPKIIAEPVTLDNLSYDECLVFAKCGASIVQEKAILEAQKNNILINVYSIDSLEKKSVISEKKCMLDIKGVMSKGNYIYLIGNLSKVDCNKICDLLAFYHFACENNKKNNDYLEILLEGGKRNFAMNILHHHFISKKIN